MVCIAVTSSPLPIALDVPGTIGGTTDVGVVTIGTSAALGDNTGTIVGGIVGGVVALVLIITIGVIMGVVLVALVMRSYHGVLKTEE